MSEWKPIETAPKDGTWVLIFETGYLLPVAVARFEGEWMPGYQWRGPYGDDPPTFEPTHWMPLPAPPKETEHG